MLKRLITCVFLVALTFALVSCDFSRTTKPQIPPVIVSTSQVKLLPWQETVTAVGSLAASQGIIIKSEISGRVTAIYFRSGEMINAGDPLIQINPSILQAKFDAAKAHTQLSAADYERALRLFKQKVFAKADLDKALATFRANQSQQSEAQAALAQTVIRAPFSGKLGLRLVNQGDYLDPGKPISNLNAIDPLRVDFRIPGTDAGKLAIGSRVIIKDSTYPNQTFMGSVYAIDSQIDNTTRSLGVRASLSNTHQQLFPGSFVEVLLEVGQPQTLATVPETAVISDDSGDYVYRIIEHKAIKTPISILFQKDGKVGLTGLNAGEEIISVGGFKVIDKAPVIVGK